MTTRENEFVLMKISLNIFLDKYTLNPGQQTKRFFRFFDLVRIFPLSTIENVRQHISGQMTPDKCAPSRIPAS